MGKIIDMFTSSIIAILHHRAVVKVCADLIYFGFLFRAACIFLKNAMSILSKILLHCSVGQNVLLPCTLFFKYYHLRYKNDYMLPFILYQVSAQTRNQNML